MRLFIGLWPDEASVRQLTDWARDAHALCGGRIMKPEDLHMTLAFLGQADQSQADALCDAVSTWPVKLQPLVLARFGMFRKARVVWAGLDSDDSAPWLHSLCDTLWSKLEGLGWPRTEATFTPHISLLRGAQPGDVGALYRPPVLCQPVRCVLVASRPATGGSNYQVLAQLPFA